MKKIIIATMAMLMVFLVLTKSTYVQYNELFLIMGALAIISTVYNFFRNPKNNAKILMSSAVISYFLCWLLCIVDIIVDHFTQPKGIEDGIPMTIVFKIDEFSEDMLFANLVCMFVVVIITFLTTKTLSWIVNSRTQ